MRQDDEMDPITQIAMPIALGVLSALGATTLGHWLTISRERRQRDRDARVEIRAYAAELKKRSAYLEAAAISMGDRDATESVLDPSSDAAIRAAYVKAVPHLARLRPRKKERAAKANDLPNPGRDAMEGSENLWSRAELIEKVARRRLLRE